MCDRQAASELIRCESRPRSRVFDQERIACEAMRRGPVEAAEWCRRIVLSVAEIQQSGD